MESSQTSGQMNKFDKVFCYGGSWAYGSELEQPQIVEHPFVHWFSQKLELPYVNYGQERASLGIILNKLSQTIDKISKDSIALIIVPPDTRWYDENEEEGFYSIFDSGDSKIKNDFMMALNDKSIEWFIYHHLLFIYAIQKLFDDKGCCYIIAHDYGELPNSDKYHFPIDYNHFLDKDRGLTSILSNNEAVPYKNYNINVMPANQNFRGKYFEGNATHPNELGHQKIAELFYNKFINLTEK